MNSSLPGTKVGLVQINNSFSDQNYLPYSVAMLQAFAQQHVANIDQYQFLPSVYFRGGVSDIAQKLEGASIVFFSVYVWNFRISLAIAKALKQADPKTVIVFGGPQVPDRIEGFLEKYNFIDVVCHGEGEQVFASLLKQGTQRLREKDFEGIASISYLNFRGERVTHPARGRKTHETSESSETGQAGRPRQQRRVAAHQPAVLVHRDDAVRRVRGAVVEEERMVDERNRGEQIA